MATSANPTNLETAREDFYDRLTPERLAPLWKVLAALVTPKPITPAVAAAWSFGRIQPLLMEAGDEGGFDQMLWHNFNLRNGIYLYNGHLTNFYISQRFDLKFTDLNLLIASRR